jgi:glycerophosphoryl diester phosphodiesterase
LYEQKVQKQKLIIIEVNLMSIPKLITHACGQINGVNYSNSKEALSYSYHGQGSNFIEIDINLSADDKYVLIHDWDKTFEYLFGYNIKKAPKAADFKKLKIRDSFSTQTLEEFLSFMQENQDLHLVTDVKAGGNIRFLEFIKNHYPKLLTRIYIQCYDFNEYRTIKDQGALHQILSLYQEDKIEFSKLDEFIKNNQVKYVSINKPRAMSDFILSLSKNDITILTHTVNNTEELNILLQRGVNSVFTDTLYL